MLSPPDDVVVYEWPTSTVWMKDGILYSVSKKGTRTMKEAKLGKDRFLELCGGEPAPTIIEVTNLPEISKEVREYVAKELPGIIKAAAILSESALGKMVANLFFRIKAQPYPTKFFNDKEKALEWLEQYR